MEGIFNTEIMVDIALWTILTVVPIESVAAWGSDQGWEHVYGCIYRDFKNQSTDLSWFDGWEYWSGKHTKYQVSGDFENQSEDLSWFDGWEYWSGKHTKYQVSGDFENQSEDLSWFDGWEYWSGKHT